MINNKLTVKFTKPYKFEGKEHKEIDLSGLADLDGNALLEADQVMAANNAVSLVPEMTLTYNFALAAKVTEQPLEFFFGLPIKDALKVKSTVMTFLNN